MRVISLVSLAIGVILGGLALLDLKTSDKPILAYLLKYPIIFFLGLGVLLLLIQVF